MIRALIVDDEAPARALLREYLAAHPEVVVVDECANGFEAVRAVSELRPDLVFLDVQMPKLDGFEVLDLLGREAPVVIFVTAYDEYALRAFEVHAVDYLLKPFGPERLTEAIALARQRIGHSAALPAGTEQAHAADIARAANTVPGANPDPAARMVPAAKLAAAALSAGAYLERVLVRDGSKVHVIPVEALDYVEAQDDYVRLRSGEKSYLKQQALADIAEALDPARFVRVHRSYILNVERLARLELYAKDSRIAILSDGTRIPVSRSGYARLKELL